MLSCLREFLCSKMTPKIEIPEGAIAIASPGDLVILTVSGTIPPKHRDVFRDCVAELSKKHGVQIVVVDCDTKVTVVKSGQQ